MIGGSFQARNVFPAHAGMSLRVDVGFVRLISFPRSRGDEPDNPNDTPIRHVFSPLTRG